MNKGAVVLMMLAASQGLLLAQDSALVYRGADGKLVYVKHANIAESNKDNVIPDFSNAGYMDGGVALPVGQVPVKVTLSPQASGEDRTRIQAAINQVCNMTPDANGFRGAVLLKAGTYRLNDGKIPVLSDGYGYALNIWASGVVLRGEGQGTSGTLLYSDFAKNHTMITIEPPSHGTSEANLTTITTAYVGTGAKTFTVADASAYAVGDQISVKFTPNSTWLNDIKVNTYISNPADYWTTAEYVIGQVRKITAKSGNTITIDAPVMQPLQTKYGGGKMVKFSKTGYLQKVGIEDLRIKGIEDGGSPGVSGNGDRLRVAIRPRFLENSWIHGVTCARVSEACIMTWDAKNMTVEECAYADPRGPISGGWRYGFCLDAVSTRVLFQRCFSDYGRHDFVTHARIPGPNVFVDCLSTHGLNVLGPHHRWAIGTLFDNIKASSSMEITEFAAPSGGHAWCGAQTVGWNLECSSYVNDSAAGAQNYLIGSIGAEAHGAVSHDGNAGIYRGYWEKSGASGTHISGIRSLYFKQLEDRLGSAAVANVTLSQQRTGTVYTMLASWAGNGPLTVDTPPSVSFLAPVNLTVTQGTNLYVNVSATDPDGISRVYLYKDGVQLARSEGGAPYEWNAAGQTDSELMNLQPGAFTLKARAVDTVGSYIEKTITITVQAANLAPYFTADPFSKPDATAGVAYNEPFSGKAVDPEGGTMTFSKVSGPAWMSVTTAGNATGTPGSVDVGTNFFLVKVTDASGLSDTATMTINVIGTVTPPQTVTFTAVAAEDGYVNESTETSNIGGSIAATNSAGAGLRIGDTTTKQQIKTILSFDTASIPDGAVIQAATLKMMRGAVSGTPTTLGLIKVDIKGSTGFNGSTVLQKEDFQAVADATGVATMSYPSANGTLSTGVLSATGLTKVNKTGKTQLKVYFATDDDNDTVSDYLGFYPAENATAANRPVLVITYQ